MLHVLLPTKTNVATLLLRDRLEHVETSYVAHFTTHILACPATNKVARFVFVVSNIAIQLV